MTIVRYILAVALAALAIPAITAGDLWVALVLAALVYLAWPTRRRKTEKAEGGDPDTTSER